MGKNKTTQNKQKLLKENEKKKKIKEKNQGLDQTDDNKHPHVKTPKKKENQGDISNPQLQVDLGASSKTTFIRTLIL